MEHWPWVAAAMAANGHSTLLERWLTQALQVAQIRQQPPEQLLAQRFWPGLQDIPATVIRRYQDVLTCPEAQRRWQEAQQQGWQLLLRHDPGWPSALEPLPDMPALLFAQGDVACLQLPAIAMVGARHASLEGRQTARTLAGQLAGAGLVVISGLALGIDGAAHEGAVASGRTLAVLGQGPGTDLYPARHRPLAQQIREQGGLLITEFPPGLGPRREFFPQRNRLISGLSQAVIVVEAAIPSGSLITARLAAEQGREVFAVPGSIRNPLSRGCHQLLRDGAHWLEDITDLVSVLGQQLSLAVPEPPPEQTPHPLLSCFVAGVNAVETLQQHSGLSLQELLLALSTLELEGRVQKVHGGYSRC